MTKKVIDGIIKDWGDRLHYSPVKGSKGRNIRSGGSTTAAKLAPRPSGPATQEKIARTAKKTPEVMVKISGGGKKGEVRRREDPISVLKEPQFFFMSCPFY